MSPWIQRQTARFYPESLKPRNTLFKTNAFKDLALAFSLALIIMAGEFTARRILSVLLPTYFDYFFMDLVCLGGFYAVLCLIIRLLVGSNVSGKAGYSGFSLKDAVQRDTLFIAIIIIVVGIQLVNKLDVLLFSGFDLNPDFRLILEEATKTTLYTNTPLYSGYSKAATSIIFILVNGIWVPIAEEFLWRGIIQTKLSYYTEPWIAIITTSILFSLKHAVVDLVLTRLLFLFVFGLAVGWAKQCTNTGISTLSHGYINLLGTIYWIIGRIF